MFPDSDYAHPVSSFQSPVPPPAYDPTEPPLATICVNPYWLPHIRGCLKQLLLQSTWNTTDLYVIGVVQQQVFDLISLFDEDKCGDLVVPNWEFYNSSGGLVGFNQVGQTADHLPFGSLTGTGPGGMVFSGRDIDSHGEAGGIIDQFDVYSFGSGGIQVTSLDCFDHFTTASTGGTHLGIHDLFNDYSGQSKRLYLSVPSGQCLVNIRWINNWECGPA